MYKESLKQTACLKYAEQWSNIEGLPSCDQLHANCTDKLSC